jgi:hypothetical protein
MNRDRDGEDEATVGRDTVQPIGPTHARGLENLAGVRSNIRQGEPKEGMRLDFDLSCGVVPLRIDDQNYKMGLKTCFVSLTCENGFVLPGSNFEHWLEPGDYSASGSDNTESERVTNAGAQLDVDLDSNFVGKLAAKIGLGASHKSKKKSQAVTEHKDRIGLVVASGQDRWLVGDHLRGDARQADGLLMGEYFRNPPDKDGDPMHLCRIKWQDQTKLMQVMITVSAAFGSLLIYATTQNQLRPGAVTERAVKIVKRRSALVSTDHDALLRAYIAGLAAAKRIRSTQHAAGEDISANEFKIARLTLLVTPDLAPPTVDVTAT